jgi:Flp pilus assembly pilin Flp
MCNHTPGLAAFGRSTSMQFPTRFTFVARFTSLARAREDGQTMAEYAVVLGVITVALIAVFSLLGSNVSTAISTIASRI